MPNPVPIMFPLKGIDENAAYAGQPGRPVAVRADHVLNVRPHDALERRARGGQRTGISKYLAAAVNGSNSVQAIASAVQAFDPNLVNPDVLTFSDDFEYADGDISTVSSGIWTAFADSSLSWRTAGTGPSVVDSGNYVVKGGASTYSSTDIATPPSVGEAYVIAATVRVGANAADELYLGWRISSGSTGFSNAYVLKMTDSELTIIKTIADGGGSSTVATITSNLGYSANSDFDVEVRVNGNAIIVFINNNQKLIGTMDAFSSNTRIGFAFRGSTDSRVNKFYVYTGVQPASLRSTKLIAIAGGTIKVGNATDGLETATNGGSALKGTGRVAIQGAFQKVFFADGISGNYQYMDLASNTVSDWATDLSAGSLPAGSVDTDKACRIMALYRGRIVMAGLQEEPQNWFMSKAGDPFDWDYSPTTTSAQQAVAGNNSDAGELGDILTALMPYQDDLLFMGGDHTLWVMRGDPAAGGQIDNISRQVGVVGPDAWTWDTGSTLYFFGQNGLYRLTPGSATPELISKNRLDRVFSAINTASRAIRLVYDREWQGVHIFITPQNEPDDPVDHYFWDERTNSFWRDQYPTHIGPTAVHLFDADDPVDRAVLLGGFDSYIRSFDDAVMNDDGTAIDSYVKFPLLHPGLPMGQFQMTDLQIHTDQNGDTVALDIFRGHTPEEAAVASTAAFTKTLAAGRNLPIRKRIRGNTLVMRMRNNTAGETWAYEAGTVIIEGVGRQRARL